MGTLVFQATLGGAVNIIGPNIANTINFTLPSADGTSGQTWTTNGSGLLTFGTLGVAGGGTGQTTLATGALGYGQGTSAHASLAIGTAGQVLTVNSGATAPQWSTLTGVAVTTFSAGTTGFTPSSATSGAVTLAGTLATTNGGTGLTAFTSNQVFYASSTSAFAQSANLTFNGTTLTANTIGAFTLGGTVSGGGNQINNVIIGTSTPLAGSFTTLTTSSTVTHNGGTANGVTYLNGSKVLTSGTALTFDGASLGLTSASTNSTIFTLGNTAASGVNWALYSSGGGPAAAGSFGVYNNSTSSTAFVINASNNIGVGVTPSAWSGYTGLQVKQLAISSSNSADATFSANAYYNAGWKYQLTFAASRYDQYNGIHSWYTAASGTAGNAITFTQAMTLTAAGAFLVGTTTLPTDDNNALAFGVTSAGEVRASVNNAKAAMFKRASSNGTIIEFRRDADVTGTISVTSTATAYNTTSSITTGAQLNSSGVTFPATQVASSDANTLDDYEEGTWTPVINGDTTAGVGVYTTQTGTYTKVGRLVYIRIALAWSAHTGTGVFYGTGLPFTASSSGSNTDATMAARTDVMTYTAGGSLSCKITQGNTTWWPGVSTNGNNGAAIAVDSAAGIYISGCYEI